MQQETSIIGPSTVVRGSLRGAVNLEIQGSVEGDVEVSGDVVLAEGSSVRGNVSAASITVWGTIEGDLRGSEAVIIETGAKVAGDLSAPRIGIAPGALVRGTVHTDGEAPLQPARRAAPATTTFRHASPAVHRPLPQPTKIERIRVAAVEEFDDEEAESERMEPARVTRNEGEQRRPPPPVVPTLGKGVKAKKKKNRQ
jgi:cytoskeletal protein CcmA (bactofilin family)